MTTSIMFTIGLFANEIVRCFPLMPLEEAERLTNPLIRKNFIERVSLYQHEKDVQKKNESCINSPPLKAEQ